MASEYPSLKFVTAPDNAATVLLDLFDDNPSGGAAPRSVLTEGFSLGVPELEGDPDAIDPLYGPREVTVPVEVRGSKAQALALLSSLSRILLTGYSGGFIPGLWLRVQVTASTQPVWFRLLRPEPADLSWDNVYTDAGIPIPDRWQVTMTLPAEAFGYGAVETLSVQTVNNDPTSGTNPMRIVLPTLKGDAPAPLRVQMVASVSTGATDTGLVLASHASTSTTPAPLNVAIGSSDGLTAGSGVGAGMAGGGSIGGSHRIVDTTVSPTMTARLTGSTPTARPGRYRAYLRTLATATHLSYAQLSVNGVIGATVPVSLLVPTQWQWIDLGLFTMPLSVPAKVADQGPNQASSFVLKMANGAGNSTSVTLDHLLFVPVSLSDTVESRVLMLGQTTNATTDTVAVDGDTDEAWNYVTATGAPKSQAGWRGTSPVAVPGCTNSLFLMRVVGSQGDTIGLTTATAVSYYPRYLNAPEA